MAADLCFKGEVDELLVRHASRLGYRAVACRGPCSASELGGVRLIPRYEVRRDSVGRHRGARGLRVLLVESKDDLKAYPRLAGAVDSIRIDFGRLGEMSKDFIRRVVGLGVPVEIEFAEVIHRLLGGHPLDYYYLILRLYARNKLKVYVCSGATDPSGMVHPHAMAALVSVLGVPEDLAAKAVFKVPSGLVSNVV